MSTGTELQRITENSVQKFIAPKVNDLIALIGKENMLRETSFAIQAANSNTMLMEATPQSVAKAVWNTAITGLSLNPVLKLAYLTPRRISGTMEALLMPSYMGLSKLITDTGAVINIYAHVIYRGDEWDVEYGTERKLTHKPKFISSKKDDVIAAYSVAVLHDGSKAFELMSLEELHSIRERSDGYRSFKEGKAKSAIWESDFGEMCRKTTIKRLAKYLPKSDVKAWEKVMEAIKLDDSDYPMSLNQENYIRNLLQTSTFDEKQRQYFENQISDSTTQFDAEQMIETLKMNQLDPITQRGQYSQTDIKNKQNEIGAAA